MRIAIDLTNNSVVDGTQSLFLSLICSSTRIKETYRSNFLSRFNLNMPYHLNTSSVIQKRKYLADRLYVVRGWVFQTLMTSLHQS